MTKTLVAKTAQMEEPVQIKGIYTYRLTNVLIVIIFLFINLNICFGCSIEPSH